MEKIISCCGVVCSDCEYYPHDCAGCPSIQGKVFWLQYTGDGTCPIYKCCISQKKYKHCGQCPSLPCERYELDDPNYTKEENEAARQKHIKLLKSL